MNKLQLLERLAWAMAGNLVADLCLYLDGWNDRTLGHFAIVVAGGFVSQQIAYYGFGRFRDA